VSATFVVIPLFLCIYASRDQSLFKKVFSASFSPDDIKIVSASEDGTIRIGDFPPLQELID